jgi:hypothetical protein
MNELEKKAKLVPSEKDVNLVCKWWGRKKEIDNGLSLSVNYENNSIGQVKFHIEGRSPEEEGYGSILSAKIYEIFGVYNPRVAAIAIIDCFKSILPELIEFGPQKVSISIERHCENIISLFQEMRPRDAFELMIVTKLIMLNYLSNREFIGSSSAFSEEMETTKQIRGIKLSRLFLEFKEKLDKHRKPDQQITVQHNHVYNEGQAIIGSQLNAIGGEKNK